MTNEENTTNMSFQQRFAEIVERKKRQSYEYKMKELLKISSLSPELIKQQLEETIKYQPELTEIVSRFIYLHLLRVAFPDTPQQTILINGPENSGKTEIWNAAKNLFSNIISIETIDAKDVIQEGWLGDQKMIHLTEKIKNSAYDQCILIIDNIDALFYQNQNKTNNAGLSQLTQIKLCDLIEKICKNKFIDVVLIGRIKEINEMTLMCKNKLQNLGMNANLISQIVGCCTTRAIDKSHCLEIIIAKLSDTIKFLQLTGVEQETIDAFMNETKLIKEIDFVFENGGDLQLAVNVLKGELLSLIPSDGISSEIMNRIIESKYNAEKERQDAIRNDPDFF